MSPIFSKLTTLGIEPDEFISFLQEALHDARTQQEIQNLLLTQEQRIKLDMKLTRIERLIVHMQRERL